MLDKLYLTFGGAFFMAKYSYEEKLEAVLRVIEDGMSIKESAHILGTNIAPVQRWVARYRQFGPEGLLLKHGTYDGAFKVSVVEYMQNTGASIRKTAAYFNIPSYTTVANWERIYHENGKEALFEERRGGASKMGIKKTQKVKKQTDVNEDLLAEVQRLRMENEYLKKLNALIQERENSKKLTK